MPSLPTQRSLALCKKLEWRAAVVEKFIGATRQRKDVFGFGDILVLDGHPGSLLVQACAGCDTSKRTAKIVGKECAEAAVDWLRAGNRIEVWGWTKKGPRGKRKLWTQKRVIIDLDIDGQLRHETHED